MQAFAVSADWLVGQPVTEDLLSTVDRAWETSDETFCSSARQGDVLRLEFDVSASDFHEAASACRAAVEALRTQLDLPGKLIHIAVCSEDGMLEVPME